MMLQRCSGSKECLESPAGGFRPGMNLLLRMAAAVMIYVISTNGCSGEPGNKRGVNKEQAIIRIKTLRRDAFYNYRSFVQNMSENEARRKTIEWAREQGDVKEAGLSRDGVTIWILLKNGLEVDISAE